MRTVTLFAVFALAVLSFCFGASVADAAILITVDKSTQRMTVNVDGMRRWVWPVSTGKAGYDTPNGQYTPFRMEAEHFSKEWDDAPMPHSIFFTKKGHAIHGSLHTRLGQPASHGCVRLAPGNAAKLYALVEEKGLPNTHVVIEGEIPQAAPVVAKRERHPLQAQPVAAAQPYTSPDYPNSSAYMPPGSPFSSLFAPPAEASVQPPAPEYVEPPGYAHDSYRTSRAYAPPIRTLRGRAGSRVYYAPTVEVTEDTYVNGVRVRRHYVRRAVPSDFR